MIEKLAYQNHTNEIVINMLQTLSQIFLYLGAVLGIAAFMITFSRFILDYFVGSNVKFLKMDEITFTEKAVMTRIKENEIKYSVSFTLTLVFTNEGNKAGIVEDMRLHMFLPRPEVKGQELIPRSESKMPLTVKPRDCNQFVVDIKWRLEDEIASQLNQEEVIIEADVSLLWRRTMHTGKFFKNKVKLEEMSNKFTIKVTIPCFSDPYPF